MSRQLKFRAWFEGHMYEVAKLDFWGDPDQATCDLAGTGENGEWEELFDIYVGDVELMQYTGMKDKNGVEIYEGDLCSTDLDRPFNIVVFRNGAFMYECHDDGETYFDIMTCINPENNVDDCTEVIGNIFENPELLEARS